MINEKIHVWCLGCVSVKSGDLGRTWLNMVNLCQGGVADEQEVFAAGSVMRTKFFIK